MIITADSLNEYLKRIAEIRYKAMDLQLDLEELDEDFTDPEGILQDEIEEYEEKNEDECWEEDGYEAMSDMSIESIIDELDEYSDIFIKKRNAIIEKQSIEHFYHMLYEYFINPKGLTRETVVLGNACFLYDRMAKIVNETSRLDFVRHISKIMNENTKEG